MHGVGDAAPALDLLVGDDAGLADEGLALVVGIGALGDDQPDAGALPVVLDDEVPGDAGGTGAHAGERGHDDAVGEVEVAELVAQGLSNEEIAGRLFLSLATVKSHLTTSMRRLGVRSRTELAILVTRGSSPAA